MGLQWIDSIVQTDQEPVEEAFRRMVVEYSKRETEALRLFRALPNQDQVFLSGASELAVTGGNRSSKTTVGAVRFASIATGVPVNLSNGSLMPPKFANKHPLNMWCIGFDERHIGKTLYRVLFLDGLFRVIKDRETGVLRAWRPWEKEDAEREDETKPSAPLIPPRFYNPKDWSWEDKSNRVFNVARLLDNTEIRAYSSKGHAAMGDPCHVIWIDEDIANSESVSEWQARLSDYRGILQWTAYPYCMNNAMVRMVERADEQKEREKPDVVHIRLSSYDNPYFPEDEKRKRTEGWTEDEIRARMLGEMILDTILCYPNYSPHFHDLEKTGPRDEADRLFLENNLLPPADWNNWLVVDPGHTVAAGLFLSVPPSDLKCCGVYLWNEVYDRNSDSRKFAKACYEAGKGLVFEGFIIDNRAGRQTPLAATKRVRTQYSEAFAEVGLVSRQTEHAFYPGSDNVEARMLLVRDAFVAKEPFKLPVWRFVGDRLKNFKYELSRYKKKVLAKAGSAGDPRDKPIDSDNHLCNAIEYWAAANGAGYCDWYPPEPAPKKLTPTQQFIKRRDDRRKAMNPYGHSIICGAGVPNDAYGWM